MKFNKKTFKEKAKRRRQTARLPFEEKLKIVEELNALIRDFAEMKRPLLTFLLVISSLNLGVCQEPHLQLQKDLFDWGRSREGAVLEDTVRIKNTGDDTLRIEKYEFDCPSCMTADSSIRKIPPRGKGKIKITLNTQGYKGSVRHFLYLFTNDSLTPVKKITFTTYVLGKEEKLPPLLKILTPVLDFGRIKPGGKKQAELLLKNTGEDTLEIYQLSFLSFPPQNVPAETLKLLGGTTGKLTVFLTGPNYQGKFRDSLVIISNYPEKPRISVPVRAKVEKR
ncbi:MAG: DUF1573 domain-containing protein [Candidatus Edwardsbacteria bacterium]